VFFCDTVPRSLLTVQQEEKHVAAISPENEGSIFSETLVNHQKVTLHSGLEDHRLYVQKMIEI
jgi:hypothetical protein